MSCGRSETLLTPCLWDPLSTGSWRIHFFRTWYLAKIKDASKRILKVRRLSYAGLLSILFTKNGIHIQTQIVREILCFNLFKKHISQLGSNKLNFVLLKFKIVRGLPRMVILICTQFHSSHDPDWKNLTREPKNTRIYADWYAGVRGLVRGGTREKIHVLFDQPRNKCPTGKWCKMFKWLTVKTVQVVNHPSTLSGLQREKCSAHTRLLTPSTLSGLQREGNGVVRELAVVKITMISCYIQSGVRTKQSEITISPYWTCSPRL